ncbi:MAG: glycosyltransferase family 9 protein [Terricaulis sp.]
MASLLFIAPLDLGETVLATGALAYALSEGDQVCIVSGPEAAALFRAAPGLAARHVIARGGGLGEMWRLWFELVRKRFDLVIDARGGLPGGALAAARRVALKPAAVLRHRTEDWAEAMGSARPLAPKLWVDAVARARAAALAPGAAPVLVLAPGGVTDAKRWPWERFAAVARRLAGGPLGEARIVVLGAARRDADLIRMIVSSLDADGVAAADLSDGLDLLDAAALMERATLCLGNDNALTHIAAAMGAPTLTLFGPTDERARAPFGPRVRTLRGRGLAEIAALTGLDANTAMEDVSIDAVEAEALDLLHAGGLR